MPTPGSPPASPGGPDSILPVEATIEDLRSDVPLLIVRAGKDQFEAMNASIDPFVAAALRHNLPLTCINHPSGPHAFDLFDDSRAAQIVVRQVLAFLALHLDADR